MEEGCGDLASTKYILAQAAHSELWPRTADQEALTSPPGFLKS